MPINQIFDFERCFPMKLLAAAALICLVADNPLAAAEADSANLGQVNAFAGPLTSRGELTSPQDEDIASPYVEAHWIEQRLYSERYRARYHVKFIDGPRPEESMSEELASPVDAHGSPLWFDRPNGYSDLNILVRDLL